MWLDNIAKGVPQTSYVRGIEPKLELEYLGTDRQMTTLRVRAMRQMAPPWMDRFEAARGGGITMDFTIPRSQVAEAAESLRAQLQRFPPRFGAENQPPFAPPQISPRFFVDWLLIVPGASEIDAIENALAYMRWIHLDPVVQNCLPIPEKPEQWHVRLVTELWVPENEPFRALFQVLSYLPMPYGAPRVSRPYLRPDGVFRCGGRLDPVRENPKDLFSRIRGWFELTNEEDEQRFWWQLGQCGQRQHP
jgi:hypothetical protein